MSHLNPAANLKGKRRRSARLTPDKIEQIQTLVKKGMSLRGVARETRISYSVIHAHAKQFSKQQTTLNFSVFSKRELGYIVGFFVGDGSQIAEKKSGHYGAKFALDSKSDLDIASLLRHLFERGGKRVTLYSMGSWLAMKIYSKSLLLFLQGFVGYQEQDGRAFKVLISQSTWSRDFSLGFVGGLIDADGHVLKDKWKVGHFGAVITTVNLMLAQQLLDLLNGLELKPKVAEAEPSKTSFSGNKTYFIRLGKVEFCKVCSDLICVKHERCGCNAKHF